jgi:hypothetical protein
VYLVKIERSSAVSVSPIAAIKSARQAAQDGPERIEPRRSGLDSAVRMETSGFMLRSRACRHGNGAWPRPLPLGVSHSPDIV